MSPTAIQQVIADRFESLSPELQRAARWVSRHGSALALHSMRDSARAAEVSPATMTRLARRLGFDGFEQLRAPFRRELAGGSSGAEFERMRDQRCASRSPGDVVRSLVALQQANVASVIGRNQASDIDAAALGLIKAPETWFLGMRACHGIAFYLGYAYGLLQPNGRLVSGPGGTELDQVARLRRDDVLVAVSQAPYTRCTVEAVELARGNGAAVVALTDSPLSPLARGARQVLLYDTASSTHFHSAVGAQALAEALIAAVAARAGAAAQAHLRRTRNHLENSAAYWERTGPRNDLA